MGVNRIVTNICSDDLVESKNFYTKLLGFEVMYQSDWYIQLVAPLEPDSAAGSAAPAAPTIEVGIIQRDHELVPARYQAAPTGMYVTFVVKDVDTVYAVALELGLEILQPPRNEFYGQRRFLTLDPNGCLIDVSSPSLGQA